MKINEKVSSNVIETIFIRIVLLVLQRKMCFIRKLLSALKFWFEYKSLFMGNVELTPFLGFCLFYYFCIFVIPFPLRSLILHVDNWFFVTSSKVAWKCKFLLHYWLSAFRRKSNFCANLSHIAAILLSVWQSDAFLPSSKCSPGFDLGTSYCQ